MMARIFENLLLLALPASGKSETRKYMSKLDGKVLAEQFHLGPTVQLDDFPYVHVMRRVDDELVALGRDRVFFHSPDRPFQEGESWGILIHLINEDYRDLVNRSKTATGDAALRLLTRFDAGRKVMGKEPFFIKDGKYVMPAEITQKLLTALEKEAQEVIEAKNREIPESLEGKTVVIEFARGGADGSTMPIPWGYETNLKLLSPEILEKAAILYIWVTPEESRRKNDERSDPNDPGSILKHGVPIEVMMKDYGCDDIDYVLGRSDHEGYVKVERPEKTYYLPLQKFDNRVDKTSFVRNEKWGDEEVRLLHEGLRDTCQALFVKYEKNAALH